MMDRKPYRECPDTKTFNWNGDRKAVGIRRGEYLLAKYRSENVQLITCGFTKKGSDWAMIKYPTHEKTYFVDPSEVFVRTASGLKKLVVLARGRQTANNLSGESVRR